MFFDDFGVFEILRFFKDFKKILNKKEMFRSCFKIRHNDNAAVCFLPSIVSLYADEWKSTIF